MMKKTFHNIATLLLIVFSLHLVLDGSISMPVQAANMTKEQQKAKEQAAKQKEKEKAAKQKEKEKAAKQKEKEKAAKQKAKEQAAKQKAKDQAAKPAKATVSREEAYQLKVAEIEKYNEHVARYMSRDITHRIGVWGQVGYSNLFPGGFTYNESNATGFTVQSAGGVGGGAGLGYQLRYKRMLFTTGVELEIYNSLYRLSGADKNVIARSFGMQPYASEMTYSYAFVNSQDKLQTGFVQIPVLFGMEFANRYAYFLAGPKVGIGVIAQSNTSAYLTTSIIDEKGIQPYQDIASHALVKDAPYATTSSFKTGLNLALYGEIGMSLDPWINVPRFGTRLALFAEYGVLNIQSRDNLVGNNDQPVDYSNVLYGGHPTQDVAMVSSLSTTTASGARMNPFLVGVKATFLFDLPRKELKPMRLPKEPTLRLATRVVNADNNASLAGASVVISSADKTIQKTTNNQGMAVANLMKGTYQVAASKIGYYADSTTYALQHDLEDTVLIRLVPEPVPVVYTYCGRVFAQETQMPLEAQVQIDPTATTKAYAGTTAEDGLFVTNLLAGRYATHIRCQGYMPYDDTITFTQDTLSFYLTKIKEGIRVKINHLYFATNRTYILPESEASMLDLAQFLMDNESVSIRIVGHTDAVGSDRANQILSEGRANSVRMDLIKRGIAADRIEAEGRGESEPIANNETEEGRAQNRRVEFVITGTKGEDIQQIR